MTNYLLILPAAFLVAYSQIVVKLRSSLTGSDIDTTVAARLLSFLSDPWVITAYASTLIASFAWLFIITKLPLTTAFPIYIGVTFLMVLIGGWMFLAEAITATKVLAALLILAGVAIGVRA